jgi:predicted alpha/beta hydrolase family esterase
MIRDATSWTYWTDVAQRSGWHWQVSNQVHENDEPIHRLLDRTGKLLMLGPRDQVLERWLNLNRSETTDSISNLKPVVLILHGLGRTRRSMTPLFKALQKRLPDIEMQQFAYASMINRIDDHAHSLAEYVALSFGSRPMIFVAHSLGNIVLRRMYRIVRERGGLVLPESTIQALNVRGHAMLGPPNQGSLIAKRISRMPGTSWIMGPSFLQVGAQWDDLRDSLDLPPCPTAIIAGDVPSLRNAHPLLPAPNDGLVLVDEARLSPDEEIEIYPILHSLFMYDQRVHDSLATKIQKWLGAS